jgi:uncharacterized repeat protein (TIGR02543 family)
MRFLRTIISIDAITKMVVVLLAVVLVTASTVIGYYMVSKPSPSSDVLPKDIATTEPSATYVLTVNSEPSSGGSVSVSPSASDSSYISGTVVTLTPSAANGWVFSGWSGDLSGSANPATVTVSANKVVTATFTQVPVQQYSLSVSVVGSGCSVSKNPNQASYASGTVVTLTPLANQGYKFDHFTVDGTVSTINPFQVTMSATHTVVAYFTQIPIPICSGTTGVYLDPWYNSFDRSYHQYYEVTTTVTNQGATGYVIVFAQMVKDLPPTLTKTILLTNSPQNVVFKFDVLIGSNPSSNSTSKIFNPPFCWATAK